MTYNDAEIKRLSQITMFAGMTADEIEEWILRETEREHIRWEKEHECKRQEELKRDKEYIEKSGDKNVLDPNKSVQIEIVDGVFVLKSCPAQHQTISNRPKVIIQR